MKSFNEKAVALLILPLGFLFACNSGSGIQGPSNPQLAVNSDSATATQAANKFQGELIKATIANDFPRVRDLLRAGADVNDPIFENGRKITPLLVAVAMDNEDIARLLIDYHADTQVEYMGYTASDFAFYSGQPGLAREMTPERK